MGNKLGRRRPVVDERYTKPQGLYVHKDVDHKKLRKLILESKLAPCFPGDEETFHEHEECPICFLYYPSLNRSRCCMKGICTECFLQMKNPNSARPTQCPFCKTSNYAVEYRGVKTKEEKGLEQIEEQRVIEAKIRMRQQELQDEEERTQNKPEPSSSNTNISQQEIECSSSSAAYHRSPVEIEETTDVQRSYKRPAYSTANREEEFDLDLEDIMVMEAIWLSIQAKDRQRNMGCGDASVSDQYALEARYTTPPIPPLAGPSSSPSGGLACAIAALAERQQLSGESSFQNNGHVSTNNMGPGSSNFYHRMDQDTANYISAQSACHMLPDCRMTAESRNDGDWCAARGSDAAEAGTSYASSDTTEDCSRFNTLLPPPPPPPLDEINGTFDNVSAPIVPETFEEQMMLAMAVSLAEARAMAVVPRSDWQ